MRETKAPAETSDDRSAWATFLLSLLHRTPEHLNATKAAVQRLNDDLMPECEARYSEIKGENDPPTFAEWERQRSPEAVEQSAINAMMHVIVSPRAGPKLINMHWMVVDLAKADHRLMTSDNPVILVPLDQPKGHIAIPLSPTLLFVATKYRSVRDGITGTAPSALVRTVNRLMVERASLYVIAASQAQDRFVRKWFGTCRVGSFAAGLTQPNRPTSPRPVS